MSRKVWAVCDLLLVIAVIDLSVNAAGTVCKNQGRHRNTGECFLKLYLDHFGVSVKPSAMRMLRTRSNGLIPRHDHGWKNMNIEGNAAAIADYNRCVYVSPRVKDKNQNTLLNSRIC